jgi:hypothetical protein
LYYVKLDGEDAVRVIAITYNVPYQRAVVAYRVTCRSPRCRNMVQGYPRQWSRFVIPGGARDPRELLRPVHPLEGELVVEGVPADEVAEQHRKWHLENFPVSGRVLLDRWIEEHSHLEFPEPDREEIKRNLAIAREERRRQRGRKTK